MTSKSLRETVESIRRKPYPISDLIPQLLKAADELERLQAENESPTESLAKCRDLMPSDSLDRVGSNLLNCACSRTDCVADYVEYSVAAMKAEIESLRADAVRYAWVLPIITGDDDELASSRTMALGMALLSGKTGNEVVDAAMKGAQDAG